MKAALAVTILAAVILVFAGGSFVMDRMMNSSDHASCLLAIYGSSKCLGGLMPLELAASHINTLTVATTGIVGSFAAVLLMVFFLIAWPPILDSSQPAEIVLLRQEVTDERRARSVCKERRWISLLEKRDPSL